MTLASRYVCLLLLAASGCGGGETSTVPGAPSSVTATAGDEQATVAFLPPTTNGGSALTGYLVTGAPGGQTAEVGPAAREAKVQGLTNGTAYTFTVAAKNGVGTGENSAPSAAVTPAGVPDPPTQVVAARGNQQAAVSWNAPARTGGSALLSYEVTASPGGATVEVEAPALTATVSGLLNGTAYTFTVVAKSARGTSVPSSASSSVTPAGVPGPPRAVVATRGNAQAQVQWSAPAQSGGAPISSYKVTASPGGASATAAGSTLTALVSGLSNGASYVFSVLATNAVGDSLPSESSAAVTPATVPGAPTALIATRGNGEVTVGWTAPASNGGEAVAGYVVTASPGGATQSAGPSASAAVVSGLSNGTAYTFTVKAQNAVGLSEASVPSAAVTPATTPLSPTQVTAVRGDTVAQVSWVAPASSGGSAVTGYTVTASPGGAGATVSGASTLTAQVSGLTNGTAYTFTVTAQNALGASPPSSASAPITPATVPDAPTAVSGTRGNAEAQVRWTAPASTGGSAVTGYVVTAAPGGATQSAGPSATSAVVSGLANGTAYTFTVRAQNAVGSSAASAPSAAVTPETVPTPPTAVTAARGNTVAQVSWSAPSDNGGTALVSYTVTASPGGATASVSGSTLTAAVTGLTNGTAYTFTVVATNGLGDSLPSAASSAVTPATVPSAPTAVSGTRGNAQVTVSWTAPTSNGGAALTGFTVTAAPGGATQSAGPSATSAVVAGLTNGTAYTFTVTAQNAVGSSAASLASPSVTPATTPGAPTAVSAVGGNAKATVSWSAPGSNGGAAIAGYTVTSSPGGVTASVGAGATTAEVTGLTPETSYTFTVTATNAVGTGPSSSASSSVTVLGPPGAPTQAIATRGNAQAQVSWTAPASTGGSTVTGYTVTSSPGGLTASVAGATLAATVTGLTNGTAYTFTVVARNAVATSPASSPSNAVTPSAAPPTVPGAPTSVVATRGNAQVQVSWTAPADDGGSGLTGYTVTASPGGLTASVSGATLVATVTGLTNGTAYTFSVVAQNALGSGAASSASSSVTPATVPGAPTSVLVTRGNAQVQVSWTAPASNGGATLTGYVVTASPGGLTASVSGATLAATVTGLTNGTAYTFTVVAQNAVGSGAASSASSSVTPAAVPGAPTIGPATRGVAAATASWTPPLSDGGAAITGYLVTASPGGTTASAGPSATMATVSGLTNGTAYTFTVVAQNAVGPSASSSASNSVTPSAGPSAPTGVSATIGNAQAKVLWTAPSDNGGSAITGYTVTSSPGGKTASAGAAATSATVTGLSNGTAYTFTVVAQNGAGSGDTSAASNSVTPTLCTLAADTAKSAVSTPTLCPLRTRDTRSCLASRTALGLSGFWLKFSCRVTLSMPDATHVQLVSDSQPDYESFYFATSNVCYEAYPGGKKNPSTLTAATFTLKVNVTPTGSPTALPGVIGMALNGVYLFSNQAAPGDDIYKEAETFDACQAHPNTTGYHYHSEPYSLSYNDSNLIGVMADGWPLYGRYDPGGNLPAALDGYGGHTSVTVDSPSTAVYHYHVNEQTSSNAGTAGTKRWFLTTGTIKNAVNGPL